MENCARSLRCRNELESHYQGSCLGTIAINSGGNGGISGSIYQALEFYSFVSGVGYLLPSNIPKHPKWGSAAVKIVLFKKRQGN